MTATEHTRRATRPELGLAARRVGFVVAIVVNVAMVYVANNLLGWDLLPFLTSEFGDLLWVINLSLGATIIVNIFWLGYDADWFRLLCQIGLNLISALVLIRLYRVFPFDFSAYEFEWALLARAVIVLTMVALAVGTVVELVKLARGGYQALSNPTDPDR